MKVVIVLFVFILTLQADALLSQLFETLKTTPRGEKFKVMNEIKKHIVQLKQQERIEAIKLLQEKKRVKNSQIKETPSTVGVGESENHQHGENSSCTTEISSEENHMHFGEETDHASHMHGTGILHNEMKHMHTMRDAQAREEMMQRYGMDSQNSPSMQPNRPSMGGRK